MSPDAASCPGAGGADVAVVIPVYGRERPVAEAIASALAEPRVAEIIVVDDGSAPPVEIAPDARVRLIRCEANGGPAAARNRGIEAAEAPWIALLDSDDRWRPGKLERQFEVIAQAEADGCVCGFTFERSGQSVAVLPPVGGVGRIEMLAGARVGAGSTLLVRREVFDAVGLFDEGLRRQEDWEWLLRATATRRFATVPEALVTVSLTARPNPHAALAALAEVARLSRPTLRDRRERRTLAAGLALEEAAARRWSGRPGHAALCLARAAWHRPIWTARSLLARLLSGGVPGA